MHDQADDLRQLVRRNMVATPACLRKSPKLVVATGGRPGVGVTTIAVNLAVELARRQYRTVLVDADLQPGHTSAAWGLEERYTIADVLSVWRTVNEALQTREHGLRVLPGVRPRDRPPVASDVAQERLISQLQQLGGQVDLIVVDSGCGFSHLTRRFWRVADMVLVVTTPDAESVIDAYASIKLLGEPDGSTPVYSLVNMARGRREASQARSRLIQACRRFLGIEIEAAGHVHRAGWLEAAESANRPVGIGSSGGCFARRMRGLVGMVVRKSTNLCKRRRTAKPRAENSRYS